MQKTVENINERLDKVEKDVTRMKQEALQKKKAKDERGALNALRKAKMYEKELAKLEG